jgi:hypothetical protein
MTILLSKPASGIAAGVRRELGQGKLRIDFADAGRKFQS